MGFQLIRSDSDRETTMLRRAVIPATIRRASTGALACARAAEALRPCSASPHLEAVVARHLTRAGLAEHKAALRTQLDAKRTQLAAMRAAVEAADRQGAAYAQRVAWVTFGLLCAQFGVLFNWVFFEFDWNLVEPVTYFLGYTCVWLGIVFYARTGCEWTYDATRELLAGKRAARVLAKANVSREAYEALAAEVAALEAEAAGIDL